MRSPSSIKQEFLRKWLMGLRVCCSSMKNMNAFDRKNAIKLSADIAMASSRKGTTSWSRAIVANASREDKTGVLIPSILNSIQSEKLLYKKVPFMGSKRACHKRIIIRSKKILAKGSGTVNDRGGKKRFRNLARSVSKRLMKKRTQILKCLIPGGEFMDEVSLIQETLDYIVSLRAQVDVMRSVADGTAIESILNPELTSSI